MKISLYLLFMLYFTAGCINQGTEELTGYTGGSVLLPCTCTDPQSTVKTFSWRNQEQSWSDVFHNENYKGRLKLFNESSPTNLSLLISDLRKQDEGKYRCEIYSQKNRANPEYRDIKITIKGCDLVNNTQKVEVMGRPGESVVLPCYCKELQAKPQQLAWTYSITQSNTTPKEIYPSEQSPKHKDKIKLLNKTSPGDHSLLLSNLTTQHKGYYTCSVGSQQYINIRLQVKATLQTNPRSETEGSSIKPYVFALISVFSLLLLTVLAVMIWRRRGTRDVKNGTSDGLVLHNDGEKKDVLNPDSSAQDQHITQDETEDEVTYSTVVHVKNAARPAQKQIVTAEYSEYACLK